MILAVISLSPGLNILEAVNRICNIQILSGVECFILAYPTVERLDMLLNEPLVSLSLGLRLDVEYEMLNVKSKMYPNN
jgi:hypothetical protein